MKETRHVLPILISVFLVACATNQYQPFTTSDARLGAETSVYQSLKDLPPAREKIAAAVYKFRDQTGQYKPTEFGQNFSTAVTQGATSILLRALEESNWFLVIERENLNNLLNERKIIRSSRAQYNQGDENGDDPLLPPLLFAGVILEGGIVSYDANVVTGGAGLRYFGAGASGQYREDKITVYLRAISTSNGRVLKTVYTSKTILSQMLDVGLFRYVKFKRLLEFETGITHNEPTQMAVTEAIEKSVQSLVIEGMLDGLWGPRDTADYRSDAVKEYLEEKSQNSRTDGYGRFLSDRRRKTGLGVNAGSQLYDGDLSNGVMRGFGELSFSYAASPATIFTLNVGYGKLATRNFFNRSYYSAEALGNFLFVPRARFTPKILAGAGVLVETQESSANISGRYYPNVKLGMGFEYMFRDRLGLDLTFIYNAILNDRLDDVPLGNYNDYYWKTSLGLKYYFGRSLYK
ncbi:MAG: CsgG/HfaB family protein [Vicingaceae bacterium]